MKTRILMIIVLLLLVIAGTNSNEAVNSASDNETIRICTTSGTRGLAESWIAEYNKTNPEQSFEVRQLNFSEVREGVAENNSLGFLMQRPDVSMVSGSMWRLTVGRDVIVAVMNKENPFAEMLDRKGVSAKELANFIEKEGDRTWGALIGKNRKEQSAKFIILDEPEVQLSVSKFLEIDPSVLVSVEKKSINDFLEILQRDKYAVGFCRLANITDTEQHDFIANVKLLPIDRNGNGHLDYNENIYADLEQFERSAWIGKYPRSLVYNIYAVAPTFPENQEITDFLSWVVTSGQIVVEQSGFTDLVYNEKQSNLEKLNPPVLMAKQQPEGNYRLSMILLVALVLVVAGIIIFLIRRNKSKSAKPLHDNVSRYKIFNLESLKIPNGLYYDKSHTWVFMEEEGLVKLGIDDFIPKVTGDYTRIILKNPGEKVKRKEPVVTLVQKGKQITISAPVSGTIKEINEALVTDPFIINHSPYGDGWVYKIEPSNWFREIRFFKLGDAYRHWMENEFTRLKDFLACSFNIKHLKEGKPAFQEGGELAREPLKEMGPEIWEDFQSYFIDSSDKY